MLLAAGVLTSIVIVSALLLPWARLPAWLQASVPLTFFVVVAMLRQSMGGAISGYSPLVMLPLLWLAIYGSRTQFRVAIAATALTFLTPQILVGAPLYPEAGWRGSIIWVAIGLLAGSATQKLVAQSRHRSADVAALGAITRTLSASSDPRPDLCAATQLVTGAAFAVLFEPHDENLVATAGTEGVNLGMQVDPRTHNCATAKTWLSATRTYVPDIADDPHSALLCGRARAHALLCQPVIRNQRKMAVLVVGFYEAHQHAPSQALYLVELLAAEVGAAIDRANLVALLEAQSRRDPLTGAANRRSWDEEIGRELARAGRTGDPLTVAIIDMDHFKAFNDANGHLAGDVLLKDFVTAIRAELRPSDVVARWGGEEFALALPDCDLQRAQDVASRLLKIVPNGQTASIGLTQAGAGDTPRALIERADRAVYAAKDGGRNQVRAYQGSPALSQPTAPGQPSVAELTPRRG
ncbi:MAG: sensor domain-containing diguanylate cyclase [Dermatophilaceae bacterium]